MVRSALARSVTYAALSVAIPPTPIQLVVVYRMHNRDRCRRNQCRAPREGRRLQSRGALQGRALTSSLQWWASALHTLSQRVKRCAAPTFLQGQKEERRRACAIIIGAARTAAKNAVRNCSRLFHQFTRFGSELMTAFSNIVPASRKAFATRSFTSSSSSVTAKVTIN